MTSSDRLHREEDALLGIDLEVGDRRRGELPRPRILLVLTEPVWCRAVATPPETQPAYDGNHHLSEAAGTCFLGSTNGIAAVVPISVPC